MGPAVIGQRINNYEIVEQIGEGGMGAVYMARHPFIDRKVAVKVLRAALANDPAVVHRFFNEAKAANAIRHPNIIDIIDVGLLSDGRTPYLIMELLEGENVSQRLKRAPMSPEEVTRIAVQTASAVTAAHAQGIIHRDLKPENLFLARDPRTGQEAVKVLDFGIAKLRTSGAGDGVRTQTGALMGTPPYMSPEQCRGISAEVDQRTDVYALGIILYEMLCGAPPFVGEGFGDVLVQHLTVPPAPPRTRNPAVPAPLERVVLRALAKPLGERYQTMAELQAALEGREEPSASEPFVPTTSEKLAIAATTFMPFQRQTTTLSATAGEVEGEPQVPRSSRRGLALGGAAALAATVALFAMRSPGPPAPPAPHAAVSDDHPVTVPATKPDAGVTAVPPAAIGTPETTATRPIAAKPPKHTGGKAKAPPSTEKSGESMGKW
jgi:serine/threonine-protein kinase